MQSSFQKKLGIDSKSAVVNSILVVNALVWYLSIFSFLKSSFTGENLVLIVGINLLVLILSAFVSSTVIQKTENRLKFLVYWMVAGVFLSPIPLLLGSVSFFGATIISAVIGAYFGLGFPVLMGYYAAKTENENRARVSGLTILFNGIFFLAITLVAQDALSTAITLMLWKLGGVIAINLLKPTEVTINKKEKVSYKKILKTSSIMLYFVPWLMFSLVDNFAFPILDNNFPIEFVSLSSMIESVLAGIFAVFFGFFADSIGRKRLLLFGFALIGLGYAALGFLPPDNPAGWWFYTCANGIAWGGFTTLFLLTLWGDLADKRDSEKFYVVGFIPYLLSSFLKVSVGQYVADSVTNLVYVFSFASFFLFAAVLPLYLAPETLPEKAMKDRNLKSYLEKAQKLAEKEAAKKQRKGKPEKKQEETAIEENSKEYEEAQKLAEQYY